MLPKFPLFKKLELSDQADIESITSQYLPYSNFNFSVMWSWNVEGITEVSELSGNLVVISEDCFSNEPSISFLGNKETNKTLTQLFDFSVQTKIPGLELKALPETSLQNLDSNAFAVEIDLNSCDYVYNLQELSKFSGSKYERKRHKINQFLRNYNNLSTKILDLSNLEHKNKIRSLNDCWAVNKTKQNGGCDSEREFIAIENFLNACLKENICVGIFLNNDLYAYSINMLSSHNYSINLFAKFDTSIKGIGEYLMSASAAILLQYDCVYLNYEEDLGLPGLRYSKNSYNPINFLKKYNVKKLIL